MASSSPEDLVPSKRRTCPGADSNVVSDVEIFHSQLGKTKHQLAQKSREDALKTLHVTARRPNTAARFIYIYISPTCMFDPVLRVFSALQWDPV